MAFLDTLLEVEMNKPGTLSQDDIRQEVDTFTFEGHDTTSASLVFTLFLLGSHPEIQDKVAEELYSIFGDSQRSVEMKDLQQMVYLEKVIKESLRLYPSVPYISRALIHDLNLPGDVLIPKGANVIILPYILHRNKRFYPDPEVFDPERFNEDQCLNRHPFAYIPFSAGPRNCIGQKFAMMALKIILSTIIRKAKIESITTKEELRLLPFLILRPSEPIMIKVKPRQVRAESTV
ncbi:hypothetical protein AAG570_002733 [Ranatra chinensis]|uniref:Cytochrome P450 n=1 Tax=Ranatra chinensis TaxID=642074 RepID=A0ABD0YKL3_9HEMI